jgi:hypothetical protein
MIPHTFYVSFGGVTMSAAMHDVSRNRFRWFRVPPARLRLMIGSNTDLR